MKPLNVDVGDYNDMVNAFHAESDRGAAVLAGSYVETYLGVYLQSKLVDASLADRLFSSDGPLSSFSQRIVFAQAFGYLPKDACMDLNVIRKVRNHFAHHPKAASFSDSPVRELIQQLSLHRTLTEPKPGGLSPLGPRAIYLVSAGMFTSMAHNLMLPNGGA